MMMEHLVPVDDPHIEVQPTSEADINPPEEDVSVHEAEEFTAEEEQTLRELNAKRKRIERAKKATEKMFAWADNHREAILARWDFSMSDKNQYWADIKQMYGCEDDEKLFKFIIREKAINLFREREKSSGGQGAQ